MPTINITGSGDGGDDKSGGTGGASGSPTPPTGLGQETGTTAGNQRIADVERALYKERWDAIRESYAAVKYRQRNQRQELADARTAARYEDADRQLVQRRRAEQKALEDANWKSIRDSYTKVKQKKFDSVYDDAKREDAEREFASRREAAEQRASEEAKWSTLGDSVRDFKRRKIDTGYGDGEREYIDPDRQAKHADTERRKKAEAEESERRQSEKAEEESRRNGPRGGDASYHDIFSDESRAKPNYGARFKEMHDDAAGDDAEFVLRKKYREKREDEMRREAAEDNKEENLRSAFRKRRVADDRREADEEAKQRAKFDPTTYAMRDIERLGMRGSREASQLQFGALARTHYELANVKKTLQRRARGANGVELGNINRQLGGVDEAYAAIDGGSALHGGLTGMALGGIGRFAGPLVLAQMALDVGKMAFNAPDMLSGFYGGQLKKAQLYNDYRTSAANLGRAGGYEGREFDPLLLHESGGGQIESQYGITAGESLSLLGRYGIRQDDPRGEVSVLSSILRPSVMPYLGGMDRGVYADLANLGQTLGAGQGLGRNGYDSGAGFSDYWREFQKTATVAVMQGVDKSQSIGVVSNMLRMAGSNGAYVDNEGLQKFYRTTLDSGSPGARTGEAQMDWMAASNKFGDNAGVGGGLTENTVLQAYMSRHGGKLPTNEGELTKYLGGDAKIVERMKSNPVSAKLLDDMMRAGAAGDSVMFNSYLGQLMKSQPELLNTFVNGSGLVGNGYSADLVGAALAHVTPSEWVARQQGSDRGPSGVVGDPKSPHGQMFAQVVNRFMTEGHLTREQAVGIATNFDAESSMNPHETNGGMEQLLGERRAAFAKKYGHDVEQGTWQEQVDFALSEEHNDADPQTENAWRKVRQSTSAGEAAYNYARYGERPLDLLPESERRRSAAAINARAYPGDPNDPNVNGGPGMNDISDINNTISTANQLDITTSKKNSDNLVGMTDLGGGLFQGLTEGLAHATDGFNLLTGVMETFRGTMERINKQSASTAATNKTNSQAYQNLSIVIP